MVVIMAQVQVQLEVPMQSAAHLAHTLEQLRPGAERRAVRHVHAAADHERALAVALRPLPEAQGGEHLQRLWAAAHHRHDCAALVQELRMAVGEGRERLANVCMYRSISAEQGVAGLWILRGHEPREVPRVGGHAGERWVGPAYGPKTAAAASAC
mgnify:CR=1 FL=1